MVDFLRRHWETAQETLNIKNNKDFYGELQTVTTEKPFMKNVLAFIRKQQYLQWWKKKMIQGRFVNRYFGLHYPSNNLLLPSAPSFGKQGFFNGDNSETFFLT